MGCLLHYSPKFYNNVFMRWLDSFWDFLKILIHWFSKLSVQTFKPLIIIYRRCNFVYHYWGCTSIYWQLSYLFRSLQIHTYTHIIYVERISWESASSHSESRIWNFNAYLSSLLHLPLSLSLPLLLEIQKANWAWFRKASGCRLLVLTERAQPYWVPNLRNTRNSLVLLYYKD